MIRRSRRTHDRVFQPQRIVIEHLAGTDLDGGALIDVGDQWRKVIKSWSCLFLEQAALEGIPRGAARERLNLGDEFVHVFELTVNRYVTDVGHGIDLV